jgi:iron complex outermembrane recepter protein
MTVTRINLAVQMALSGAVAATASPSATAQEVAALEEVVVTATRRTESLQDVPLSVAALSSEQMESLGITGVGSLIAGQVPSVQMRPFAGNPTILLMTIRGFTNPNGGDVTNENPVPVYIDDIYYGRPTSMAMELADLERIEVLRGPQGTLFGKNSAGGTVRVISKDPTGEFGLTQKLESGNYGYWKSGTHVDLPEVGNLSAKLDVIATDRDGWIDNQAAGQQDYGRVESLGGKVTLLWRQSDSLNVKYSYDNTHIRTTETFNQVLIQTDLYNPWPVQRTRADSVPFPTFRPLDQQRYEGHRLGLDWKISDSLQLRSITGYRDDSATFYHTAQSAIALPGAFFGNPNVPYATGVIPVTDDTHDQISQEFQLSGGDAKFNWVAGLFYMEESGRSTGSTYFGTLFPNAITAGPPTFFPIDLGRAVALQREELLLLSPPSTSSAENKSYAAFAEATVRPGWLDNRIALTAGVRFGHDEKEAVRYSGVIYESVPWPSKVPPPATETCPCAPRKFKDDQVSPLLSVGYDWTDDVKVYFRYSTGYVAPNLSLGGELFQFDKAADVQSYELGLKSEWANRTLRLNLSTFWLEWNDVHESLQTTSASTVEYFSSPKLEVSGVELDANWRVTDALSFSLAATYYHADKESGGVPPDLINPDSGGVVATNNIVQLPEVSWSAAVDWDIATFDWGKLWANVDANHVDEYWSNPQVSVVSGDRTLLNARLSLGGMKVGAGNFDITLWGTNFTDEEYLVFNYAAPGVTGAPTFGVFGEPRMYGVTVTLKF